MTTFSHRSMIDVSENNIKAQMGILFKWCCSRKQHVRPSRRPKSCISSPESSRKLKDFKVRFSPSVESSCLARSPPSQPDQQLNVYTYVDCLVRSSQNCGRSYSFNLRRGASM